MKLKSAPGGWYLHPFEIGVTGGSREKRSALAEMLAGKLSGEGRSCGFIALDNESEEGTLSPAEARTFSDRTRIDVANGPRGPETSLMQQSMATVDTLVVAGAELPPIPALVMFEGSARESIRTGKAPIAVIHEGNDATRARDFARRVGAAHVLAVTDREAILEAVRGFFDGRIPAVHGLVLAGGKSTRMGRDKAAIEFTPGTSQARRAAELLSQVCDSVYLSARAEQPLPEDTKHVPVIPDLYDGFGPLAGILSAFAHDPRAAWFVVGCDMPLLESGDVRELFRRRNPYRLATCFATPADSPQGHTPAQGDRSEDGSSSAGSHPRAPDASPELLPEPLCAVYEPKARTRMFTFLAEGVTCPRWMLRNGGADYILPSRPQAVYNANDAGDLARAKAYARAAGNVGEKEAW
ncbi:MAG: NTP transferase domain-containing protein [Spirochaetales bacterium]